jgi:hypothetical protein
VSSCFWRVVDFLQGLLLEWRALEQSVSAFPGSELNLEVLYFDMNQMTNSSSFLN